MGIFQGKRGLLAIGILVAVMPSGWSQIHIPLRSYYEDGTYQRIGIELAIGGSDEYYEYILDTGSDALMIKHGVDIGGATFVGTTGQASYGASGGDTFNFGTYIGTVQLKDKLGGVHSTTVEFGRADSGSSMPGTAPGGILGAGPSAHTYTNKDGTTQPETPTFNLFSILGQITVPEGLMGGFTIRLDGENSMLTIGISESYWDQVTNKVTMTAASSPVDFPNTGLPTYDDDQMSGTVIFTNAEGETFTRVTPFKIDSGAPDNFYVTHSEATYEELLERGFLVNASGGVANLMDGITVSVPEMDYEFVVGPEYATQVTVYEHNHPGTYPHFNTGINPYNAYEVTFLFDDGSGNGYVGFLPIPEPSSVMLVLLGIGTLLRRRRVG